MAAMAFSNEGTAWPRWALSTLKFYSDELELCCGLYVRVPSANQPGGACHAIGQKSLRTRFCNGYIGGISDTGTSVSNGTVRSHEFAYRQERPPRRTCRYPCRSKRGFAGLPELCCSVGHLPRRYDLGHRSLGEQRTTRGIPQDSKVMDAIARGRPLVTNFGTKVETIVVSAVRSPA